MGHAEMGEDLAFDGVAMLHEFVEGEDDEEICTRCDEWDDGVG